MSTVVEESPAGREAPARPGGSLLRAEAHRFRARRFIQVLVLLAVVGWLIALFVGLTQYGTPDAGDIAAAEQRIEQELQLQEQFRQECLESDGGSEELCGEQLTADDFRVADYLATSPFDLAGDGRGGVLGFGAATGVLAFLIGATWIGAEWSTRSLVALLFWVPQRLTVMGTKIAVLAAASALFAAGMQLLALTWAGILQAAAGSDAALPDDFWSVLLATQARCVLFAVLAALAGFGLANLVRNTGAALGVGFVYFAIAETAIRILRPAWEPWLLSNNAVALVNPGGVEVYVPGANPGPDGMTTGTSYLITNLQAGLVLGVVTAVVVALGVVLFTQRDIH